MTVLLKICWPSLSFVITVLKVSEPGCAIMFFGSVGGVEHNLAIGNLAVQNCLPGDAFMRKWSSPMKHTRRLPRRDTFRRAHPLRLCVRMSFGMWSPELRSSHPSEKQGMQYQDGRRGI